MKKRKIRWMRIMITTLLLLSIISIATPTPTGNIIQKTYTEPKLQDPYQNITRIGHHNFSVIFDYKIMFLGYDINETLLRQNDTFQITCYWKALDNIDRNYNIFLHFTDQDKKIQFQDDHDPPLKTIFWQTAKIYNETRIITVPSNINPQELSIHIGWWNPKTAQRLIIQENNNILALGKIKIIPD